MTKETVESYLPDWEAVLEDTKKEDVKSIQGVLDEIDSYETEFTMPLLNNEF